ncbi:uncharacterized protein LOC113202854 [Frankliniella occidentalis]|uniref:Uncharacterized protein LOC113202854 n=1 Tax=Frankliniella occidentalis TaxID=133901 RepID=A0A6J1S2N9_FRAOC|nr:uncharacterized protein LOC113202854 [Frankliniella occidentalis]
MGTMGPVLAACPPSVGPADALLQGYRHCLREALRHLVEHENTPTADPRVLALTTHLARRQAALELDEELRRRQLEQLEQQHLRRRLLDHYFRGVDLHCMASPGAR